MEPQALDAVGKSILGKVVVVEREDKPGIFLVKRVQKFHSGKFWVEGDANESTDSRNMGLDNSRRNCWCGSLSLQARQENSLSE